MERLREAHRVQIQVNAETVLKPRNILTRRWINHGIEDGWIDVIASDAHDLSRRPCNLGECAAYIEKEWGKNVAQRLCSSNANKIIACKCRM